MIRGVPYALTDHRRYRCLHERDGCLRDSALAEDTLTEKRAPTSESREALQYPERSNSAGGPEMRLTTVVVNSKYEKPSRISAGGSGGMCLGRLEWPSKLAL